LSIIRLFLEISRNLNYLFEILKSKEIKKEKKLVKIQGFLALGQSTIGEQVFNN